MSMYQPAGAVQDTDSDETTEEEPTAAAATEGSKEDKDEPASDDKDEDDEDNDDETKNNAKILEGLSEEVCSMLQVGVVSKLSFIQCHLANHIIVSLCDTYMY